VQQGYWAFGHNPTEYARSVHCPTLMIRGGCDPFIKSGEAESVFNNMNGPKQMVVIHNAAHEPCINVDRRQWASRVTEFLLAAPRGAAR
jgi:uncharacterized protein